MDTEEFIRDVTKLLREKLHPRRGFGEVTVRVTYQNGIVGTIEVRDAHKPQELSETVC